MSGPPSSLAMKPKPLSILYHLTVPVMSVAVALPLPLPLRRAEGDWCGKDDDDDEEEDGTKATADEMVIADTTERRNRMIGVASN